MMTTPDTLPGLGPEATSERPVPARFIRRRNRFVAEVRLADGTETTAYLPNTARLYDLLLDDVQVLLERSTDKRRSTAWTLTRVRARGIWVSLEAAAATDLLAGYLASGGPLGDLGPISDVEREVTHGSHRLDLRGRTADGASVWIEVKSLSRCDDDGAARLSRTPWKRATDHLAALGSLVEAGEHAVVAFVLQRPDVDRLELDGDADPGWVEAVATARDAGVDIVALRCEVSPRGALVAGPVPVTPQAAPRRRSA